MKFKIIITVISIAFLSLLIYRFTQKKPATDVIETKAPQIVSIQSAHDSKRSTQKITYPAIIAGDQQATLTAGAGGTITNLSFDLGTYVPQGKRLATIDTIGTSATGENGLKSSHIQSLELDVQSAEESYKKSKDAYKKDHSYANKKSKEIAQIDLESARVALSGALDGQFVTAPISGTVIERFVSLGDSVSVGQKIATLSKTGLTKIQFYVSKDELPFVAVDNHIAIDIDGRATDGMITVVSPQADPATKRFLIEATPLDKKPLTIGSIATVSFDIERTVTNSKNIILPLSTITIGQNESSIFILDGDTAKKIPVAVVTVQGETAEITSDDLTGDTQIITDGSKLISDGDPVSYHQS
ncbi:MAG: efflux RND transporter periplasmic adaptor subunit [Parcubacteria group bacterium]|jgi:RND family efflux transporter MFP subunit